MTVRDIQIAQEESQAKQEPVRTFTPAVLVYVNSPDLDAKVAGKPSYVWASEFNQPQSNFQILNRAVPPTVGLRVKIGYPEKPPFERQVIGKWDQDPFYSGFDEDDDGALNSHPHHQAHQYPSETNPGADPVLIYQPALQLLKTTGDGATLTVTVQALPSYRYHDTHKSFPGAAFDLTSYVPGVANTVLYVLVYLDAQASVLKALAGTAVTDNGIIPIPKPVLPGKGIASAYVKLSNGQSTITTATHVVDAREFLEPKQDGTDIGGATEVGQFLYSQDGSTFTPSIPLVNDFGEVMTNNDGKILVV